MEKDICERLEERAVSYEQSGPSAHHTAALLREASARVAELEGALDRLQARMAELEAVLQDMLHLHGKPHREEWINEDAYKFALLVWERARAVLAHGSAGR